MTIMVITEKVCSNPDMSVTPPSTPSVYPRKKGTLTNLTGKKQEDFLPNPNSDNGSANMAHLSGSIARQELTSIDKQLPEEDKNVILTDVSFEPPVFKTKSDCNLERVKQGSLENNIKQELPAVTLPKTTKQSQQTEASREMLSKSAAKPKEPGLRRSNSDISLHRFRIAAEDSDSVKSIKSSPFQPKPPIIPRKTRPLPRAISNHGQPDSLDETYANDQQDLVQAGSTDDQHKAKLNSSHIELPSEQPSSSGLSSYHYDSDVSDQYLVDQVGSTWTVRSLPATTSPRLPPLTSVSSLPPFNRNFSSKTLRTAYKSEPLFSTHQINRGSLETFSQGSFASSTASALPAITTREARSRSYLFGNINSGISLLGSEELHRYFPDRKVKIFVGTWNMGGHKDMVSQRIVDFILPERCELVQDIYVIGTQENSMQKKEWEIILQENLGPSYVLFHSTSLGSLHLAVFMRRDLIWFCSNLEENNLATRAMTMIKTKGSVALAFSFFGTSLLFINSHFTACYQKMSDRVNDYEKTIRELRLAKGRLQSSKKDIIGQYNSVFWIGDFNFRIDGDACPVENMLGDQNPNFEKILRSDQLLQLINEDKIFKGFQEGRIVFPPTYKFDVKSDTYHKLRTPSYTDRVLFRSKRKNCITCIYYNCAENVKLSDHKPVFGIYEVAIRPGRDILTLDAGRFNKEVYIEANKRRAQSQYSKPVSHKSSSVCSIQ